MSSTRWVSRHENPVAGDALSALAALSFSIRASVDAKDERNVVISSATPHDRLFSVIFDADRGVAVGEAGLIMRTADAGKTWTRDAPPTELAMIDIASNGTRSIAVGQMGLILVSDGGGKWKKVASGTDRRLLQVGMNRNGLAFIVGAFGTLLKSTDGGETWNSVAPNWATLYDSGEGDTAVIRDEPTNYLVEVQDDGSALIGGEYGQIMRSPDGGICWEVVYRHPSESGESAPTFFAMSIREDGVGYAVGQSGLVARTADRGQTWAFVQTPLDGNLFGVDSFANGQVVAIGQRVALRSTDNGATWNPIRALDFSINWYTGLGHAASAPVGEVIAVGHSGRILRLAP